MNFREELSRNGINLYRLRTLGTSGLVDAPRDSKQYVRKDGAWVEVVAGGAFSGTLDDITDGTTNKKVTATEKTNYGTAYSHSQASHAPSNAQKNSDITKEEIEAKLTGELSSHSHAGGSAPTSWGKYF